MGYLGNSNSVQNFTPAVDYFNGNGSTTSFTLSRTVGSAFDVQAFIENVPQNPSSAFTVAGNVITFTSAPPSGTNNIYVRYTSPVTQQVKPAPGTVSPTEINSAYSLWNLSGSNINYTAGSVGIGVAGSSAPLDIQSDTGAAAINIRGRASGDIGSISFYNNANSTQQFYIQSRSAYTMLNTVVNSYMAFATNNTERMRITSTGNVSIAGTAGLLPGNIKLVVEQPSGEYDTNKAVQRWSYATYGITDFYMDGQVNPIFNTDPQSNWNSPALMIWQFRGTERMRITSAGTLMVGGTSSPSGTQRLVLTADGGAGPEPLLLNELRAGNTNENAIRFYRNGSQVGTITTNASSTSYNTSSDYRLKENIAPMTGALEKVAQLKPCTYTWKVNGSQGEGFIAHELAEVVPQAVIGEKDAIETYTDEEGNEQTRIKAQGVDTSFLVATLTAAIQEQQAIIEDLKARIEILEDK